MITYDVWEIEKLCAIARKMKFAEIGFNDKGEIIFQRRNYNNYHWYQIVYVYEKNKLELYTEKGNFLFGMDYIADEEKEKFDDLLDILYKEYDLLDILYKEWLANAEEE